MIIKNLLHSSESYTHANWYYKDVFVGFSRLYYIIDGEAYYVEDGRSFRFKKGHLYLTPVKRAFSLYENPNNKLLHTYSHIVTIPPVTEFTEIEVVDGTPLKDAVMLWRKYIHSEDNALLTNIIGFLLSCIEEPYCEANEAAALTKNYIDRASDFRFSTLGLSKHIGYSREHITRSFLSAYRITPKQYFNQRRMNCGLQRLLLGHKLADVAEYLNFSSPYSFSKAFKKHFGQAPRSYVKKMY